MLTYQVRERYFKLNSKVELKFPSDVQIEFVFKPLQPFGAGFDGGETFVEKGGAQFLFNANMGRGCMKSNLPLSPLNVQFNHKEVKISVKGNLVSITHRVENLRELDALIQSLFFSLPMVLNVEFIDPPYIERVAGKIGTARFAWELPHWNCYIDSTTQELQEQKAYDSFQRYLLMEDYGGHRLFAAMHYFHVACRLRRSGVSPWEFMSEILLNLCKVLEVLFPSEGENKSMESARRELLKLGFKNDEIERFYIPAIALRNKVDVAHVDLSIFSLEHRQVLHTYTEKAEIEFRKLFQRLFNKIGDKSYSIPEYDNPKPRTEAVNTINKLAGFLDHKKA